MSRQDSFICFSCNLLLYKTKHCFEIKDVKKGTGAEAKPGVDVTVTIVQAKALGPNNTEDVIYQENLPLHFVVGTNKVVRGSP